MPDPKQRTTVLAIRRPAQWWLEYFSRHPRSYAHLRMIPRVGDCDDLVFDAIGAVYEKWAGSPLMHTPVNATYVAISVRNAWLDKCKVDRTTASASSPNEHAELAEDDDEFSPAPVDNLVSSDPSPETALSSREFAKRLGTVVKFALRNAPGQLRAIEAEVVAEFEGDDGLAKTNARRQALFKARASIGAATRRRSFALTG